MGAGVVRLSAQGRPRRSLVKSGEFIWGAGPSITVPTATDDVLGSGKSSAGPSVVVLKIQKSFFGGMLVRHLWSFTGESDRQDVNQTLIQPFLNYNIADGWYLMTSPIYTSNWSASSGERWQAPIGGGCGKLMKVGDQPINLSMHGYYKRAEAQGRAGVAAALHRDALCFRGRKNGGESRDVTLARVFSCRVADESAPNPAARRAFPSAADTYRARKAPWRISAAVTRSAGQR
jgi:hypothetical protein